MIMNDRSSTKLHANKYCNFSKNGDFVAYLDMESIFYLKYIRKLVNTKKHESEFRHLFVKFI